MEHKEVETGVYSEYVVRENTIAGETLYSVWCHYPTTDPDVFIHSFVNKTNAEMFCKVLNAENRGKELDVETHGEWLPLDNYYETYKCSQCDAWGEGDARYCFNCGARMDGEKK